MLDLAVTTVKHVPPSGDVKPRDFCFDVVSPYKSFRLQAENQIELDKYVEKNLCNFLREFFSLNFCKMVQNNTRRCGNRTEQKFLGRTNCGEQNAPKIRPG